MQCYECMLQHQQTSAVGVCHHCGAAICAQHLYVTEELIYRYQGMGTRPLPRPARQLSCPACHTAETSAERPAHRTTANAAH